AMGVEGQLTDRGQQYVERVKSCANHLLSLIEQILVYSRMESGRERPHIEEVDACVIVRASAELMEPLAQEKGLRFRVETPDQPVHVLTDTAKLRQILLNLVSNAVKFTAQGEVRINLDHDGRELRIEVTDSGQGIAAQNIERIFEPFWQVEQQWTRPQGGTGLGLSVTRRLVKLLDGDMDVTSTVGRGSTFVVRLPLRPPAKALDPTPDGADRRDPLRPDRRLPVPSQAR
ncbi:MAG TPA: HAMP domain-containing sensor histidine kinase, partial [Gemmatimonadaceae bacterium]|nr:HAMP domain-containing sensor histidine kinase [Gemmatimonadaceae bacterium]